MNKYTLFKGILFGIILLYAVSGNCDAETSNTSVNKSKAIQPTEAKAIDAKEDLVKPDKAAITQVNENYGKLPLSFIRNDGQMDNKVEFYERGSGHSTYFTNEGVYLELFNSRGDADALQGAEDDKSVNGSSLLTHGQMNLSMPPNKS